jgi:hypothetical protein
VYKAAYINENTVCMRERERERERERQERGDNKRERKTELINHAPRGQLLPFAGAAIKKYFYLHIVVVRLVFECSPREM